MTTNRQTKDDLFRVNAGT